MWALNMLNTGKTSMHDFVQGMINKAKALPDGIYNAIVGVVDKVRNVFKRAYETAKQWWDNITSLGGLISAGDISQDNTIGSGTWLENGIYVGNETLNKTLAAGTNENHVTNNTNVNNTFNGLVEESAADYIVTAVNDRLKKENIIRGI